MLEREWKATKNRSEKEKGKTALRTSQWHKKTHVAFKGLEIHRAGEKSKPIARIGEAPDVLADFVDTIDRVCIGPIIPRTRDPVLPMLTNSALDNVDVIFQTMSSYPTGESLFEVKWRTLIAYRTAITHKEPPDWYRGLFRRWRDELRGKTIAPTDKVIYAMVPEEYFLVISMISNQ